MSGRDRRKKESKQVKEVTSGTVAFIVSSPMARREPSKERKPSKPSVGHTPSFTPEYSPYKSSLVNWTTSPQTLPSKRGSAPIASSRLNPAVIPRRIRSAAPQVVLTKPLVKPPKLKPPAVNSYGSFTLAKNGYVLGGQMATSNLSPGVTFFEGKKTLTEVAIRMIEQTLFNQEYKARVAKELSIATELYDRHVVRYLDMFQLKPENKVTVVVQK